MFMCPFANRKLNAMTEKVGENLQDESVGWVSLGDIEGKGN